MGGFAQKGRGSLEAVSGEPGVIEGGPDIREVLLRFASGLRGDTSSRQLSRGALVHQARIEHDHVADAITRLRKGRVLQDPQPRRRARGPCAHEP